MRIDTHAHVYPADHLDVLERFGTSFSSTAVARDLLDGADGAALYRTPLPS